MKCFDFKPTNSTIKRAKKAATQYNAEHSKLELDTQLYCITRFVKNIDSHMTCVWWPANASVKVGVYAPGD